MCITAGEQKCVSRRLGRGGETLFVKVSVMICQGCTPPCSTRCAARAVRTRVLPLPGPATTLQIGRQHSLRLGLMTSHAWQALHPLNQQIIKHHRYPGFTSGSIVQKYRRSGCLGSTEAERPAQRVPPCQLDAGATTSRTSHAPGRPRPQHAARR